jgi:thiol-disulfide isomerase/thioredoxin
MRRILLLFSAAVFVSSTTVRSVHGQESGIAVGSSAPAVEVHDLQGKPVALSRYLGKKPVFLEFWATWCELCEQLLPRVKAAKSAYGDKVEFIGVNVTVNQTPEKVRKYVEKHQPGYLVLYDDQGTSIRAYQVPSTSYVVIVDRDGKVAYTGLGGTQEFDAVLRRVTQG